MSSVVVKRFLHTPKVVTGCVIVTNLLTVAKFCLLTSGPCAFKVLLMDIAKELLKRKGKLTWTEYAKEVGLSRQSLYSLFTGRSKPGFETLVKLGLIRA
jgi:hypothetical protein